MIGLLHAQPFDWSPTFRTAPVAHNPWVGARSKLEHVLMAVGTGPSP